MKYNITEEQMKVLSTFLWRVQLNWTEVWAFNELVSIFNSPIKEEETLKHKK